MGSEWLQFITHYKLGGCRFESCLVTVESVISRGGPKAGEMANCKIWESVHYPIECVIEIYGAETNTFELLRRIWFLKSIYCIFDEV